MMHLSMVIVNNAESNILKSPVEGLTNAGCSGRMILLISSVPMQMVFYLLHHMALYIESKRQRRQSMRSGMGSIN